MNKAGPFDESAGAPMRESLQANTLIQPFRILNCATECVFVLLDHGDAANPEPVTVTLNAPPDADAPTLKHTRNAKVKK